MKKGPGITFLNQGMKPKNQMPAKRTCNLTSSPEIVMSDTYMIKSTIFCLFVFLISEPYGLELMNTCLMPTNRTFYHALEKIPIQNKNWLGRVLAINIPPS